MPKVSVIIPTYNCGHYICQAVKSILSQTFKDYEIIVVDDGSTDDTRKQLEPYLHDIKYIYQENQERSVARNTGIKHATGKYVAFLDADDYWLESYLEKQIANLDTHPQLGMSRTWVYDVDSNGKIFRIGGNGASEARSPQELLATLLVSNCMSSIAVIVRTDCFETSGLFDPELKQGEDWDMWLRIALRYPVGTIPEPLACYRHNNAYMPTRMYQRGGDKAYIEIVKKTFEQLQNHPLYELRSRALGMAYLRSAWVNYAVGKTSEGQSQVELAFEVYPELFTQPYDEFIETIAILADEVYDLVTPLNEGVCHIDRFFNYLPPTLSFLQQLNRHVKGHYCGLSLFRNYQQHNWDGVLRAVRPAVSYKPNWLGNRGFLSIIVQALLATNPVTNRLVIS